MNIISVVIDINEIDLNLFVVTSMYQSLTVIVHKLLINRPVDYKATKRTE